MSRILRNFSGRHAFKDPATRAIFVILNLILFTVIIAQPCGSPGRDGMHSNFEMNENVLFYAAEEESGGEGLKIE